MNSAIRLSMIPLGPHNARMEDRDQLTIYAVVGDAMTQAEGESFPAGTRLYVDDSQGLAALRHGDYILGYFTQAGRTFDVFGRFNATARTLEFLNPAYPPIPLSALHYGGRVVESVSTIWRRSK